MVDAYHEIEDRVTLLANIARALKPQGRIGVVDFKLDGTGPVLHRRNGSVLMWW